MKKTSLILLLLMLSLTLVSFSHTNSKPKAIDLNTPASTLKQYVGDYEIQGIILKIYTKEKENNTKLYLFGSRQVENELIATGKHKFSVKGRKGYKLEFDSPENGVFKELIIIQPNGTLKAFRKEKSEIKIDLITTDKELTEYVGEYDMQGVIIDIYTKEKENNTKLYLFVFGQREYELISTGEHKFSFKISEDYKVKFKNPENGVFNELTLIQPDGTVKATRLLKSETTIKAYDKKLTEIGFSGVVLIAQNDSIIFNKAYGIKNSQENGLNDINTVFDICSITKQFTSAGILKLSMQNKVSIDDKLSKYFDAVPNDKKNITIHQLLTHSSGLTDAIGGDYETVTEAAFLNQVFSSKLVSPVGEKFNYSNIGYSLLALIIEKVSGMDYETFLNVAIFKPSKMTHTGYVIPDWKNSEVANGFLNGNEAKKPNEENWSKKGPYLNLKGNGGILSSASDMLLWSQAIRDHTVLDEATTSKYLYPHFQTDGFVYTHYGYGWGIENNDSENKLVRHGGTSALFATDLWMYPKKGITIIVLSNKYEDYVYSIARKFSKFLLAK